MDYLQMFWSQEIVSTDPITQEPVTYREDFKYAVSSAEALDLTPTWGRATDGPDVDIPIGVMSYVKVPHSTKIGLLWHKTNLNADGKKSVDRHG